jgi:hypothetical protein
LAKKARVYDGTAWQELASAQTDLTAYSTTAQMNTAIAADSTGMKVIASGSVGTAGFSITSIPATYRHLQLTIRNLRVSGGCDYAIRVNGLSTGIYDTLESVSNGATIINRALTGAGGVGVNYNYATTNTASTFLMDIRDYTNTTSNKQTEQQFTCLNTSSNNENVYKSAGIRLTDAINRVDLVMLDAQTFTAGTFILYGIK